MAGGGAGLPTSGDIRALSEQMGVMHDALRKVWALIIFLVAVAIGLGAWNVAQQVSLNGKDRQISLLVQQNIANSRANCEAGNQNRADIRAVSQGLIPLVRYKSPADAAKAFRVLAGMQAHTAARDCQAVASRAASGH